MASLMLLVALAPIKYLGDTAGEAMAEVARASNHVQARGGRVDQEQAREAVAQMAQAGVPCCFSTCANLLLTIFVLAPVVAGATVSGAQAVAGRPAAEHLVIGLRRYGTSVWMGTLCIVLGGGVVVVAGAVASLGVRVGAQAAAEATGQRLGSVAEAAVWILLAAMLASMLWFSTRLWLALYRVLDPSRPPTTSRQALRWSWTTTRGRLQWDILALMLLLGVIAGAMQIPTEWLAAQSGPAGRWVAFALMCALAALVWMPYMLAVSGAMYERIAAAE
jgi:hypothetical protein